MKIDRSVIRGTNFRILFGEDRGKRRFNLLDQKLLNYFFPFAKIEDMRKINVSFLFFEVVEILIKAKNK